MSALRNHYGTDIRQINFGNANDAADKINTWVREQTRNNINSIVQPGT
jgi:serine protease inhibitor